MAVFRVLDLLLLAAMIVVPWIGIGLFLFPHRRLLRREWPVFLVLGLMLGGFFFSQVRPGVETLSQSTVGSLIEPYLAAYRENIVKDHQAPLWMPTFGVGLPLLANPYLPFFSPLTSLTLFIPDIRTAVTILLGVHLMVGGWGYYLLGRSLGLSVPAAAAMSIPAILNVWVFRRFGWEIHANYALAYIWLPWCWMGLLQFFRTRSWVDAARAGIPVAFLFVSIPTMAVHAALAATVAGIAVGIADLARRRWRQLGRLLFGGVLLLTVALALPFPEQLAAAQLFATQGTASRLSGRLGTDEWNPAPVDWRIRDLSLTQFLHFTFPGHVGKKLFPPPEEVSQFGIPYMPGEFFALTGVVGFVLALLWPRQRHLTHAVMHGVVLAVFAMVFVRGPVFPFLWNFFPLFDRTGVFPAVGTILLLVFAIFFGVAVDAVFHGVVKTGQWLQRRNSAYIRRVSSGAWFRSTSAALAGTIIAAAAAIFAVVDLPAVHRSFQDPAQTHRWTHLAVATVGYKNRENLPHLNQLAARGAERSPPTRIFCMSDTNQWPSPCLDYGISARRLELVGVPEVGWFVPGWFDALAIAAAEWTSAGEPPPLLRALLRLASVQMLVTTRPPGTPVFAELDWNVVPNGHETYGYFSGLLQRARKLIWRPEYVAQVYLSELPKPLPPAFVADAIALRGSSGATETLVRDAFAQRWADPERVVLLQVEADAPHTPFPEISADATAAREDLQRALEERSNTPPQESLTIQRRGAGHWQMQGMGERDAVLFLSQLFYPGTRASINGRFVTPLRANLFFSAVPVSAGPLAADVRIAPLGVLWGSLLSIGTVVFLLWSTRRDIRHTAATPR